MESFEEKQNQNPKDTFEEIISEEWQLGKCENLYSWDIHIGQIAEKGCMQYFARNVLSRYSDFLFQKVQAREKRILEAGKDPAAYLGGNARNTISVGYSPKIDTAITSPPYENAQAEDEINLRDDPRFVNGKGRDGKQLGMARGIPKITPNSENQIGNLKKTDYLNAVREVYAGTFEVLKPGGYCIVVVKPFVRNKKIIDLPLQTWKLLEGIGFELEELYKYKLNSLSFWRILHYRKNPEQKQLWHEYALVCRKSADCPPQSSVHDEAQRGQVDAAITSPPYESINDHNRKLDSTNSIGGRQNIGAAYSEVS